MLRKVMFGLVLVCGLLLAVGPAMAALPEVPVDLLLYGTGARYAGDGHTGSGGSYNGLANNGFTISWNISYDTVESEYEYNYAVSGGTPANIQVLSSNLKDFYLLVSPTFAPSEPGETNPLGSILGANVTTTVGKSYTFANALYWTSLNDGTLSIHFDAQVAPVWGSFFADNGFDSYAYNGDSPRFMTPSGDLLDYIPVPDTGAIPEPGTMFLYGLGLAGLAAYRKFRKA